MKTETHTKWMWVFGKCGWLPTLMVYPFRPLKISMAMSM